MALRILGIFVATVAVVIVAAAVYLLAPEPVPEESSYLLDRAAIERAAHAPANELPIRVNPGAGSHARQPARVREARRRTGPALHR